MATCSTFRRTVAVPSGQVKAVGVMSAAATVAAVLSEVEVAADRAGTEKGNSTVTEDDSGMVEAVEMVQVEKARVVVVAVAEVASARLATVNQVELEEECESPFELCREHSGGRCSVPPGRPVHPTHRMVH